MTETPAIEIRGVSFAYPRRAALTDISLAVRRGERLGVLGPNGGGKSTLVRLIIGELRPTAGTVRVLGVDPAEAVRTGRVGYVPQRSTLERAMPITVRRLLEISAAARAPFWKRSRAVGRVGTERALDATGVPHLADRSVSALSGGQLQRVLIARALVAEPELLVLDEPTVGIDAEGQRRFAAMLERLHTQLNLTLVTVSHDLRAVAAASDRVACLARTLHFHDTPAGLDRRVLAELFRHDVEAIFGDIAPADLQPTDNTAAPAACCGSPQTRAEPR